MLSRVYCGLNVTFPSIACLQVTGTNLSSCLLPLCTCMSALPLSESPFLVTPPPPPAPHSPPHLHCLPGSWEHLVPSIALLPTPPSVGKFPVAFNCKMTSRPLPSCGVRPPAVEPLLGQELLQASYSKSWRPASWDHLVKSLETLLNSGSKVT